MAALHGAHFDAFDPVDRALEQRRIDVLHPTAICAEALLTNDQRKSNRVDAKDQRPFLGDDVKKGFDAVHIEGGDHSLVN